MIIFLPLLGAAFILLIRGDEATVTKNARIVALWTSLLTFLLSLILAITFDPLAPGYQFMERIQWLKDLNIYYQVGIDGVSLFLVLLSTFLIPICIISCWTAIQKRVREFMLAFLVLETFMVGMFCALDLVLFYVFFEGVLIPMFLIIGIWGGGSVVFTRASNFSSIPSSDLF